MGYTGPDPAAGQRQYDHPGAGKLHRERAPGSQQPDEALSPSVLEWLESTKLAVWLAESGSIWAFPTVLTLHTAGMAGPGGASWGLDLRLLGFFRPVSLFAHRLGFFSRAIGLIGELLNRGLLVSQDA